MLRVSTSGMVVLLRRIDGTWKPDYLAYFKYYFYEYTGTQNPTDVEAEILDKIKINQYMLDLYYYGKLK